MGNQRKAPGNCTAGKYRYEIPSPHSMTLSALRIPICAYAAIG